MSKITNHFITFFIFVLSGLPMFAQTKVETSELTSLCKNTNFNQISIHDPSVFWDTKTKKFYIYGSHYCGASSSNLRDWSNWGMWGDYYNTQRDAYAAFVSNPTHNVKRILPGKTEREDVTLKSFNASEYCSWYAADKKAWINGNQWAPDVIYNPTMKKYCYYLSLNGDNWASVVVLMTSDKITGPFTYQGPVVFGGFNGASNAPKYTDTDMNLVLGDIKSLPGRYNKGSDWGRFWPNCIDPCVFFDEEGEMWLTYGSWSGGIWILKLDKNTGLRDYTYTYTGTATTVTAQQTSDAYFGKLIAGGCYVSGEGSYIQHIGDYYYLFMSYGFYSPDGGYEMRVFRSDKPTGPYKDASGNVATYTNYQMNYGPRAVTNKGMKLIGAMNHWGNMKVGECAQGHNSACVDDAGRSYLVSHTKFNNGTAGHSVRAYQLYLNKEGWLCTAPFQYDGETTTDEKLASTQPYSTADVAGDYHIMIHPYKLNYENFEESTPKLINLSVDGKVTGDYLGSWKYTDEGKSYLTITLRNVNGVSSSVFSGVVTEQSLENTTIKTICFTTVCSTSGNANCGVPLWGYKYHPKYAIAYNYQQNQDYFKTTNISVVSKNLNIWFPTQENVNLSWTSSNPDVLTNTGKYCAPEEDVTLTMTARLECGSYYWEKEFPSRVKAAAEVTGDQRTGLVAYYNFDERPTINLYNEDEKASYGRSNSTTGVVPTLEEDLNRFGQVLHQYYGVKGSNSYTRIPNPLLSKDIDGFTISAWVNRVGDNTADALWSFSSALSPNTSDAKLFITGNGYIAFNDNNGNWFDVNNPDTKKQTLLKTDEWQLVTLTVSSVNGYTLYVDGVQKLKLSSSLYNVFNGSTSKTDFDFARVIQFVKSAKYFYLGMATQTGSPEAYYDDLMIYNRELSADDVKGLSAMLNRVNDFSPNGADAIEQIMSSDKAPETVYDLFGRKVSRTSRGIYIMKGKKVFLK